MIKGVLLFLPLGTAVPLPQVCSDKRAVRSLGCLVVAKAALCPIVVMQSSQSGNEEWLCLVATYSWYVPICSQEEIRAGSYTPSSTTPLLPWNYNLQRGITLALCNLKIMAPHSFSGGTFFYCEMFACRLASSTHNSEKNIVKLWIKAIRFNIPRGPKCVPLQIEEDQTITSAVGPPLCRAEAKEKKLILSMDRNCQEKCQQSMLLPRIRSNSSTLCRSAKKHRAAPAFGLWLCCDPWLNHEPGLLKALQHVAGSEISGERQQTCFWHCDRKVCTQVHTETIVLYSEIAPGSL